MRTLFGLACLAAVIACVIGWGINLYQLVVTAIHWDPTGNWALLLLRAVGVFVFPLGGIVGLVA